MSDVLERPDALLRGHPVVDSRLAARLRAGEVVCGANLGFPSAALAEMCGYAGYDFVVIDNEHGPADVETTENLIRAVCLSGSAPIVRTSSNDILRMLDAGASGIQVPQIESFEQAEKVVDSCRYFPAGRRGAAFSTRAGGYGFHSAAEHVRLSNEGVVVVLMIESIEGLQALDRILTLEGADVILIGATDLSFSMGFPGSPSHPEVRRAIEAAVRKCRSAGKATGAITASPADVLYYHSLGVRFLSSATTLVLRDALRQDTGFIRKTTASK
ncbi:MAG: aldolase/citrate lyase family protein [Burkholderiaceae bacterium]|nr:aldolase/citrate lyase family protein [Burkholderiaceae bacterium]MDP1968995.1 aldolase/citrate lyase family protein [Burkholderiaceae bacterium]